jgi:prepilin-type N-terminal cleavage/methylation domain-containing protein
MKMFRKNEGFTLVELMVVVLIIGILVAIAIPIFNAAKANAMQKSCYANMRTIAGAWQSYLAGDPAAPPAALAGVQAALEPAFVKVWPKCPANDFTYLAAPSTLVGTNLTVGCTYAGASPHTSTF